MLAATLIQLIETHAATLTRDALRDLMTNPRTHSFRLVARDELETRVSALYRNLGNWIGDPSDAAAEWAELLPVHLHGIQELNDMVGDFFDRAMYYLARGYELSADRTRANLAS
jgi:hypothetical protein